MALKQDLTTDLGLTTAEGGGRMVGTEATVDTECYREGIALGIAGGTTDRGGTTEIVA